MLSNGHLREDISLNKLSKIDAAYLAGLIDGEGCIFIIRARRKDSTRGFIYNSGLDITMTSYFILKFCHAVTGVGSLNKRKYAVKKNWKRAWKWRVCSNQAVEVLTQIFPFLKLKKQQAEIVMLFQSRMYFHGRGHKLTNKEYAFQQKLWRQMKKLNKKGR